MLRHFFHIAGRQVRKRPFFTAVNVFGLSLGLTSCMLIALYVWDEWQYDRYPADGNRIYRVAADLQQPDGGFSGPYIAPPVAATLEEQFPEVETAQRMAFQRHRLLQRPGQSTVNVPDVLYADAGIPALFSFEMLHGQADQVLAAPNQALISVSLAEQIFGRGDVMGERFQMSGEEFTIRGVMADMPRRSHFHTDLMLSLNTVVDRGGQDWFSFNYLTYLKLKPGVDPEALEAKFPNMLATHLGPLVEQFYGKPYEEVFGGDSHVIYFLQGLHDIHLTSHLQGELAVNGSLRILRLFAAVAWFILLIAAINFINLSTARSSHRAREVGMRKVLGARRKQLVWQFLGESTLLALFATALAVLMAELTMPLFNDLTGKVLDLLYSSLWFWGLLLSILLLTGLMAGLYPALYLSGFQPLSVLKGTGQIGGRSNRLRRPLVVLQFTVSVGLMLASLTIYQQLRHLQEKDLGFDQKQVLVIENTGTLDAQAKVLRQTLAQLPEVQQASLTGYLPLNGIQNNKLHWLKEKGPEQASNLEYWEIDTAFIETFGLRLMAGRALTGQASDTAAMILNQAAVVAFGLGDDPLGRELETFDQRGNPDQTYRVIGVMQNAHYEGFEQVIGPMAMILGESNGAISLKYQNGQTAALLDKVEAIWQEFTPQQPLSYSFMDERLAAFTADAQRIGQVMLLFTGLAVVVACLGLFALATFLAEQRRREIGVRKVLGASAAQIVRLLSGEFVKLVAVALLVALPLAFYGLNQWLADYAYRIDLWRLGPMLALGAGA